MSNNNYKTILFKNAQRLQLKETVFPTNALVRNVWDVVGGKDRAHLIFRGQVLTEDDCLLTIEEVFGPYGIPVVFVVVKQSQQHQQHQPRELTTTICSVAEQDEVRCRICYSNESSTDDPLFRPCLCRGTVGLVHVSCLNAWRERPENPDAYFRCANCGYEYRIARATFAKLLSSEEYAKIGTIVCMVSIVVLLSIISWLLLPGEINAFFFDLAEWDPPDEDYPFLRHFIFAILLCGLAGFLIHLSELIQFVRDHGTVETVFAVGLSLTANGKRGIRIFCICGLVVAYRLLFREFQRIVRRVFTDFGERVLAVIEPELS